jgi:hypothetical protein
MFSVVVLGGGDTKWVACALGKENMAGAHCNHCRWSKKDFHLRRAEPWTLASIAAVSRPSKKQSYRLVQVKRTSPQAAMVLNTLLCFVYQFWISPILHDELGLVKDWLTGMEKFCDTHIKTFPNQEVEYRKHLIIMGDMLEDLLVEQE